LGFKLGYSMNVQYYDLAPPSGNTSISFSIEDLTSSANDSSSSSGSSDNSPIHLLPIINATLVPSDNVTHANNFNGINGPTIVVNGNNGSQSVVVSQNN